MVSGVIVRLFSGGVVTGTAVSLLSIFSGHGTLEKAEESQFNHPCSLTSSFSIAAGDIFGVATSAEDICHCSDPRLRTQSLRSSKAGDICVVQICDHQPKLEEQ
nr:hypothetical protein Iba_chr15cCG8550 [Ipomoea batatas]